MDKVDYKKTYKDLYLPKTIPAIVLVPNINFIMIDGQGDPNGEEFALATTALYSFSYAVKMSYKSSKVPENYYDYTVFPLEGEWDLVDKTLSPSDKSNYAYSIMIRQPDFLTEELFGRFLNEIKKKKPNIFFDKLKFGAVSEGLCCQMLHIGSYDNEPASFDKMKLYCMDNGFERLSLKHREIYLSDPRKTDPDKIKTILRYRVKKKQ